MPTACLIASDLLDRDEQRWLRAEAATHRPSALRCDRPGWSVVDGWQFLGPARFSYSLDGRLRDDVGRGVAERVGGVLGVPVRPVQSNYLYYDAGEFLGLHHDQARCPYTVVVLLDGPADPLCLHPELEGAAPHELSPLLSPRGHDGGQRMSLQDGPLVLSGTEVPHHRDRHAGDVPITLVTFSFAPEPATSCGGSRLR